MLSTVLEVVDYLNAAGWKCSKSTVYNHVKEGRLLKTAEGKFDMKTVDKYAGIHLQQLDGSTQTPEDLKRLQREKLEAETKKAKAQAEHWEHKTRVESGEYIERDLFFGEMAARAAILKNDLETFFRSNAGQLIQLCKGDQTMIPDVIDMCLEKLELFLGRYAEEKEWEVKQSEVDDES